MNVFGKFGVIVMINRHAGTSIHKQIVKHFQQQGDVFGITNLIIVTKKAAGNILMKQIVS
jgi:hypothetical protein